MRPWFSRAGEAGLDSRARPPTQHTAPQCPSVASHRLSPAPLRGLLSCGVKQPRDSGQIMRPPGRAGQGMATWQLPFRLHKNSSRVALLNFQRGAGINARIHASNKCRLLGDWSGSSIQAPTHRCTRILPILMPLQQARSAFSMLSPLRPHGRRASGCAVMQVRSEDLAAAAAHIPGAHQSQRARGSPAYDGHAAQLLGKVHAHVLVPRGRGHSALAERQVAQARLNHLRQHGMDGGACTDCRLERISGKVVAVTPGAAGDQRRRQSQPCGSPRRG